MSHELQEALQEESLPAKNGSIERRGADTEHCRDLAYDWLTSSLGRMIRSRRKALKLTLKRMEQMTGISVGYMSQIELGNNSPSLETLDSVASGLGIQTWELFDGLDRRKESKENMQGQHPRTREEMIGQRLRDRREALDMTLHELSQKTNVSLGYLSQIELGKNSAAPVTLLLIGNTLGMTMQSILQPDVENHAPPRLEFPKVDYAI